MQYFMVGFRYVPFVAELCREKMARLLAETHCFRASVRASLAENSNRTDFSAKAPRDAGALVAAVMGYTNDHPVAVGRRDHRQRNVSSQT
jgi:hypothetical protein